MPKPTISVTGTDNQVDITINGVSLEVTEGLNGTVDIRAPGYKWNMTDYSYWTSLSLEEILHRIPAFMNGIGGKRFPAFIKGLGGKVLHAFIPGNLLIDLKTRNHARDGNPIEWGSDRGSVANLTEEVVEIASFNDDYLWSIYSVGMGDYLYYIEVDSTDFYATQYNVTDNTKVSVSIGSVDIGTNTFSISYIEDHKVLVAYCELEDQPDLFIVDFEEETCTAERTFSGGEIDQTYSYESGGVVYLYAFGNNIDWNGWTVEVKNYTTNSAWSASTYTVSDGLTYEYYQYVFQPIGGYICFFMIHHEYDVIVSKLVVVSCSLGGTWQTSNEVDLYLEGSNINQFTGTLVTGYDVSRGKLTCATVAFRDQREYTLYDDVTLMTCEYDGSSNALTNLGRVTYTLIDLASDSWSVDIFSRPNKNYSYNAHMEYMSEIPDLGTFSTGQLTKSQHYYSTMMDVDGVVFYWDNGSNVIAKDKDGTTIKTWEIPGSIGYIYFGALGDGLLVHNYDYPNNYFYLLY